MITYFMNSRIFWPATRGSVAGRGFWLDQKGATAVEFGLVVFPFLLMMFLIINGGMFYYMQNSLDKGVSDATRQILTGSAQTGSMTVAGFKTLVCQQANVSTNTIDCSKLSVLMTASNVGWADLGTQIASQSCVSTGQLTTSTGNGADLLTLYVSGSQAYVMVTICYKWGLAKYLPFWHVGAFSDGSMLLQSSMAFKVEPYS